MARKRSQDEAKQGSPEWMSTYGDLVTLLLCFFVLLFSMSNIDVAKLKAFVESLDGILDGGNTIGNAQQIGNGITQLPDLDRYFQEKLKQQKENNLEEIKKIVKELNEYIKDKNLEKVIEIDYNEQYVKLNFLDGVLFDPGKAILKPNAVKVLDTLGTKLLQYPDNRIKIEGHTDNVPINTVQFPSNWYLSSARAIAVAEYYINNKGFDPRRISADGFGEYAPIATNDTVEGRAKNRRVEIKILNSTLNEQDMNDILSAQGGQ